MKVLISAYSCEPNKGSEPGVGWNWVCQAARIADVTVITRANNREVIEKELAINPLKNLKFVYFDLPRWAMFWKRGNTGVHAYYSLWQQGVARIARRLHREHDYDLVHHLTFVNALSWPGISKVDAPFVWGPIGINPQVPIRYLATLGRLGVRDDLLRRMLYKLGNLSPIIKSAQKNAQKIIVSNRVSLGTVLPSLKSRVVMLSQNTVGSEDIAGKSKRLTKDPLRVLTVGNMVSIKGFPLALSAFASFNKTTPESELTMVGDGPMLNKLKKMAVDLNIEDSVQFTGRLERSEVLKRMDESNIFLYPTFEAAGLVVLEAMARALPVVALDFGGPADYLNDDCGMKIPPRGLKDTIAGLSAAMQKLSSDEELYARMSNAALQHVQGSYCLDGLAEKLEGIYRDVEG